MKKRIFAVAALALAITGVGAATATPASAHHADCELISLWLTVGGLIPTTHLLCI